jgi:chromatin remodeling complex protein RSC6
MSFTSPTSVSDRNNDTPSLLKNSVSINVPSDDDIRNKVTSLLATYSPEQYEHFSFKDVIAAISEEFKMNMVSKSTVIQDAIVDFASQIDVSDDNENDFDDVDDDDSDGRGDDDDNDFDDIDDENDGDVDEKADGYEDDDERESNPLNDAFDDSDDENNDVTNKRKRSDRTLKLTPVLSDFLGIEEATKTRIVNEIWDYINKNHLQDTSDNRYINLDANLKKIFPEIGNRIHLNNMAKIVSKHFIKN